MEKYFNISQLAKYLKVTEPAVQHLLREGKVPAIKTPSNVYIFKKNDIDEWLREKKRKVHDLIEKQEVL
ncbi:MAG: helix-turn-helix domain-containing protein [Alphaproteobacteria bacterium]|uniref:Helix-turn-helix domain-containing protein n=1 Tax=Candidatus Nitrobium versatile TaxID=2884831 RepID=A0A953SDR6_9BACT|nr:helix-turn-helix domain-containing protein [Candidatus Nitrobium versatile]